MSKLQKILLPLIALTLIVLLILTWDSLGSIVFIVALIMIVPIYLINRFINTDRESDFTDDNG